LEEGQLGLSDALQCYEAGVQHLKQCHRALEAAERKIELLTGVDAEGHPLTQPLEDAATSLEDKAAARSQRRSSPAASRAERDETDEADAPGTLF
jgi:exodeoxyribonuclease VII small subunit